MTTEKPGYLPEFCITPYAEHSRPLAIHTRNPKIDFISSRTKIYGLNKTKDCPSK